MLGFTALGGTIVGQSWTIAISEPGLPNTPVMVTATQQGQASSTSQAGVTDGNGFWQTSGTFGPADVGSWDEQWSVGNTIEDDLKFTVVAGSTTTQSQSTGSITGATGAVNTTNATTSDLIVGGVDVSSLMTGSVSILGYSVPTVLLIVGGIGALMLFSGGSGRR